MDATAHAVSATNVTVLSDIHSDDFPDAYFNFANEDHFWCRGRFDAFMRQVNDLGLDTSEPKHGLEIGCGNGVVRRQLEQAIAWTADGADIDLPALEQNGTQHGETFLYNIHDRHESLREKYDFIIMFDVLEHIPDDGVAAFLESALYHLRPGGWIFLNVPAGEYLRSIFDTIQGHFRRYSKPVMRAQFQQSGLEASDLRYWGCSLIPVLFARKCRFAFVRDGDKNQLFKQGFQPPSPWINSVLKSVINVENSLLPRTPLGTSLLAAARKP